MTESAKNPQKQPFPLHPSGAFLDVRVFAIACLAGKWVMQHVGGYDAEGARALPTGQRGALVLGGRQAWKPGNPP